MWCYHHQQKIIIFLVVDKSFRLSCTIIILYCNFIEEVQNSFPIHFSLSLAFLFNWVGRVLMKTDDTIQLDLFLLARCSVWWQIFIADFIWNIKSERKKYLQIIQANANNHSREHEAEVFSWGDSSQSFEAFTPNLKYLNSKTMLTLQQFLHPLPINWKHFTVATWHSCQTTTFYGIKSQSVKTSFNVLNGILDYCGSVNDLFVLMIFESALRCLCTCSRWTCQQICLM